MTSPRSRLATVLVSALALSVAVAGSAEARRGGSFGSRGARTYSAPPPTATAPGYAAPVQRSMTAPPAAGASSAARPGYAQQPARAPAPQRSGLGRFGGLGGGLLAGLVTGGLIGAMLGHGFGGLGGLGGLGSIFATLMQFALIALLVFFAMRLFRRRSPAAAAAPGGFASAYAGGSPPGFGSQPQWDGRQQSNGGHSYAPQDQTVDIQLAMADKQAFERILGEVQEAFSREDYGALRNLTTPEIMSYLAEELSQNATAGRRNDVTQTRLLRADISESWREDDADYATAAFQYESIDLMRDRQTGKVLQGDPNTPTATTELWTFVRRNGADWKLSAIQET